MDIVERLEEHLRFNGKDQLSRDAKSAIERLREALRYILTHCESDSPPNAKALILFVNNALKEGE